MATERAYIMVAVMLIAVLLDRRALTLRAVVMAASLVLIPQPEALVGPGFQMLFAATTALVLVFGGMRYVDMSRLPKWVQIVFRSCCRRRLLGLRLRLLLRPISIRLHILDF